MKTRYDFSLLLHICNFIAIVVVAPGVSYDSMTLSSTAG